jgi:serine/threonine protein kinase
MFTIYNLKYNIMWCADTSGEYLSQVMNWPARMKICLGVAQGLYYLHVSSQTRIIHRDIKASNILLDKDLNPKIADFGLARPIQDGNSEIMTQKRAGTVYVNQIDSIQLCFLR